MIPTVLLPSVSLWGYLWQSTLFALLGLVGSFLLRRRPARAHQVLLLAVMTAVLVPALSGVVRHFHLGLLVRQVTVPEHVGLYEPEASMATSAAETPRAQSPAAPPDNAGSGAARVAWRTVALWTWAAATAVLLGRLLFAFAVGVYLSRRARPLNSGPVIQALSLARARLGVNQDLHVRTDTGVRNPVIWCWGRQPVLLLPADVNGSRGPVDWTGVIAHELAHWKRHDHVTGLLAELVVCALPWNPLLWLSRRRLVSLTEQACDDWVVASGQPAEDYAEALLGFQPQSRMAFVPAVVHSKMGVAARVRRILNDACGNPRTGTKWALGVTVLVTCVAVGLAFAQTRPAEPKAVAANQEKRTPQTADKPAADPNRPEQPHFAAQTFNSEVALNVWVWETPGSQAKSVGRTPSTAPLEIPACRRWWVEPATPVNDWDLLAREMAQNKVPGLVLGSATDSDLRHLVGLTELRYLNLTGGRITDAGLEHLKGLTGLWWLNLTSTQITDVGLTHLKGLTGLLNLNLTSTQITDVGLAHLKDLTGLQTLELYGTKITDAGLEHLKGLTRLQGLWIGTTKITDAGLRYVVEGCPDLHTLDLEDTQITDAGLAHLKGLTRLQGLNLSVTKITDPGLEHLKGLTGLYYLDLGGTQVTDAGLAHLEGLTRLTTLYLPGPQITDAGLAHLKGLIGLQKLNLCSTKITDAGLEHLKGLTGLQTLWLNDTQITGAGLEHLKGLIGLHILWLDHTQVTDAGLARLKGLTGLQDLRLGGTQITGAGLAHLKGLTGLQRLDLSVTKITDAGLEHLKGLTGLYYLELYGTQVTDAGLELLKVLAGLYYLNLSGAKITDAGLEHLKGLTQLGTLMLGGTRITDAGLAHLKGLTGLQELRLGATQITDAGLEHLKGLTALDSLALQKTKITDAGLELLKGLTSLKSLDLSGTQVTDAGVRQLKQSLPNLTIVRDQAK